MIGLALQPKIGGGFDAVHGLRRDSEVRRFQTVPGLDLDDEHQIAAPGNQIDFAEPRAIAPRDNAKAFEKKRHRSKTFGAVSAKESRSLFLAEVRHRWSDFSCMRR